MKNISMFVTKYLKAVATQKEKSFKMLEKAKSQKKFLYVTSSISAYRTWQ